MSDFKILKKGEKAESLYGIENKKITELELEALLDGKRIWTDINWEYAMTIQLKDRFKELELDKEINRLNNIINKAIEYIETLEKREAYKIEDNENGVPELKVDNEEYLVFCKYNKLLNILKGDNK